MNPWQISRQLKHLLLARKWPGVGGETVLGAVRVTQALSENALKELRLPCALIRIGDSSADDENPGLLAQNFDITVVAAVAGDEVGERALIGANRPDAELSSKGRGLLEIEEQVLETVRQLLNINGIRVAERHRSDPAVAIVGDIGYTLSRDYRLEAICTDQKFYHPATLFAGSDLGGGNVSLTWTLPPDRYDRNDVILRRAAGAVPPATETSGTGVTLSGPLATSVTDAPGAGVFSYSIFGGYDEFGQGSSKQFSGPTSLTITVT